MIPKISIVASLPTLAALLGVAPMPGKMRLSLPLPVAVAWADEGEQAQGQAPGDSTPSNNPAAEAETPSEAPANGQEYPSEILGIKIPSKECFALIEKAIMTDEPVTAPDEQCRAALAQALEAKRKGLLGGHKHQVYLNVAGHEIPVPHNSRECGGAVEEALLRNQTIPAPDEECRAVMLQALEIQRTAPPVETTPGIMIPEAPPPELGTPGAPGPPRAEGGPSEAQGPVGPSTGVAHPFFGRRIPKVEPPEGD